MEKSKNPAKKGIYHKCPVEGCDMEYKRPSKLEVHIRKHTGTRPYECDSCDKTYTNDSHLRRHMKTAHSQIKHSATVRCPHEGCLRELANKHSYKKHVKRYHSIHHLNQYLCEYCKKAFKKKQQLHVHIYEHTGKPPFTCELCNLGFTSKIEHTKHKRNHKVYKCGCGEDFHRWTNYGKHIKICKIYLENKRYPCNLCNEEFKTRAERNVHKKDEHREASKIFSCPYDDCERIYMYKNNLKFHIKRYHLDIKEKGLECPYDGCAATLSRQQCLDVHIEKIHINKKPVKKQSERKVRKDKGVPKKSVALQLLNLDVPYELEKKILNGEDVELEMEEHLTNNEEMIQNSSDSELEVTKKIILKNKPTKSKITAPIEHPIVISDDSNSSVNNNDSANLFTISKVNNSSSRIRGNNSITLKLLAEKSEATKSKQKGTNSVNVNNNVNTNVIDNSEVLNNNVPNSKDNLNGDSELNMNVKIIDKVQQEDNFVESNRQNSPNMISKKEQLSSEQFNWFNDDSQDMTLRIDLSDEEESVTTTENFLKMPEHCNQQNIFTNTKG